MSNTQQAYTYRAGQKIILEKQPNQFVVRRCPTNWRISAFRRPNKSRRLLRGLLRVRMISNR